MTKEQFLIKAQEFRNDLGQQPFWADVKKVDQEFKAFIKAYFETPQDEQCATLFDAHVSEFTTRAAIILKPEKAQELIALALKSLE